MPLNQITLNKYTALSFGPIDGIPQGPVPNEDQEPGDKQPPDRTATQGQGPGPKSQGLSSVFMRYFTLGPFTLPC